MLEGPLRFTVVIEAKLIHRAVINRPGMADVVLLKSLSDEAAEMAKEHRLDFIQGVDISEVARQLIDNGE